MNAARRSWAVLFADIDNFRFYNQRHGHLGGDHALEQVAQIITSNVRPKDLTARFGGEEFCVLLPDTLAATPNWSPSASRRGRQGAGGPTRSRSP